MNKLLTSLLAAVAVTTSTVDAGWVVDESNASVGGVVTLTHADANDWWWATYRVFTVRLNNAGPGPTYRTMEMYCLLSTFDPVNNNANWQTHIGFSSRNNLGWYFGDIDARNIQSNFPGPEPTDWYIPSGQSGFDWGNDIISHYFTPGQNGQTGGIVAYWSAGGDLLAVMNPISYIGSTLNNVFGYRVSNAYPSPTQMYPNSEVTSDTGTSVYEFWQ